MDNGVARAAAFLKAITPAPEQQLQAFACKRLRRAFFARFRERAAAEPDLLPVLLHGGAGIMIDDCIALGGNQWAHHLLAEVRELL